MYMELSVLFSKAMQYFPIGLIIYHAILSISPLLKIRPIPYYDLSQSTTQKTSLYIHSVLSNYGKTFLFQLLPLVLSLVFSVKVTIDYFVLLIMLVSFLSTMRAINAMLIIIAKNSYVWPIRYGAIYFMKISRIDMACMYFLLGPLALVRPLPKVLHFQTLVKRVMRRKDLPKHEKALLPKHLRQNDNSSKAELEEDAQAHELEKSLIPAIGDMDLIAWRSKLLGITAILLLAAGGILKHSLFL